MSKTIKYGPFGQVVATAYLAWIVTLVRCAREAAVVDNRWTVVAAAGNGV
jgi:hypothetical protein